MLFTVIVLLLDVLTSDLVASVLENATLPAVKDPHLRVNYPKYLSPQLRPLPSLLTALHSYPPLSPRHSATVTRNQQHSSFLLPPLIFPTPFFWCRVACVREFLLMDGVLLQYLVFEIVVVLGLLFNFSGLGDRLLILDVLAGIFQLKCL